jgi:hypothetical protein
MALPSVCFIASSNVHSALLEGFDKGKIIGRSLSLAIFWRIDLSKMPRIVDSPIKIVGLTYSTTSGNDLNCCPLLSSREKYILCWASLSPLSLVIRP